MRLMESCTAPLSLAAAMVWGRSLRSKKTAPATAFYILILCQPAQRKTHVRPLLKVLTVRCMAWHHRRALVLERLSNSTKTGRATQKFGNSRRVQAVKTRLDLFKGLTAYCTARPVQAGFGTREQ